ncbi:DNA invertase Pin-like site-specific DNA recombinase [Nocardia kruczakiae]|uniref:DNA invertase Pin-like site-specific DNA recombinase n=1 Tax=Nocardia kruczakiae TaxID=261477 RepID=A0ABU1X9W7_9NOCA|nr:recombinase family protein [Nocardia kruczakiae]MDR7167335.1 DNA invertase Pin-like site-specific DNA recombinase [Nocardia kruczakiae]
MAIGFDNAIDARRGGDEFRVTELGRLSLPADDLHKAVDGLAASGWLCRDGKVYDPADLMGKMFIGMLGLMTEFESDRIRSRTRDARAAATAADDMKGRTDKLTRRSELTCFRRARRPSSRSKHSARILV